MEFIEEFLKQHGSGLIGQLTEKVGFSADKAGAFLPRLLNSVMKLVGDGKLDLANLLSGNGVSELLAKLDIGGLAGSIGIEPEKAEAGVKEVGPSMISSLQGMADSPEQLLGMLGGDQGGILGSVGKLAGDLFKK
jgi:hypothetical protein